MFSPQANQRLLFGVIGPFIIIFLRLSSVSLDRSRCHFMRSQTIRTDRALADCYSWTAWSSGLTHARNRQGLMLKVLTIHRERTRRIVKGKLPIHDEKPLVFRWNSRRFQIAYRSNPLADISRSGFFCFLAFLQNPPAPPIRTTTSSKFCRSF